MAQLEGLVIIPTGQATTSASLSGLYYFEREVGDEQGVDEEERTLPRFGRH